MSKQQIWPDRLPDNAGAGYRNADDRFNIKSLAERGHPAFVSELGHFGFTDSNINQRGNVMTSLLFIIALAVAAILSFLFPPLGILIFLLLGLWLAYVILKGGVKGLYALFSLARCEK